MSAITTPARPKAMKPAAQAAAKPATNTPSAEAAFMKGKALAALMIREGSHRTGAGAANINASYRDPGTEQDNFTAPFLHHLKHDPHLLPGFSAALSSMLAEGMDTSGQVIESAAEINYSACTICRNEKDYEAFDSYSEPPLDEQLAAFALKELATAPAAVQKDDASASNAAAPAPIARQQVYPAISESTYETISAALWRARAVTEMLSGIFMDEPGLYGEDDLLGLIQHVQWQICRAQDAARIITSDVHDLHQKLFEARSLISIIEAVEDASRFKFQQERISYCGYFDAITECTLLATKALELVPVARNGGGA
ncbi:MAG: hypothetical protein ACN6O3_10015 [Comamonas sp.]